MYDLLNKTYTNIVIQPGRTENEHECILTNLPDDEFSIDEIKELYA